MEKDWRFWADAEDAMDRAREQRFFGPVPGKARLCQICATPVATYRDRIDGAGNIQEIHEELCQRCQLKRIQNQHGCDELDQRNG